MMEKEADVQDTVIPAEEGDGNQLTDCEASDTEWDAAGPSNLQTKEFTYPPVIPHKLTPPLPIDELYPIDGIPLICQECKLPSKKKIIFDLPKIIESEEEARKFLREREEIYEEFERERIKQWKVELRMAAKWFKAFQRDFFNLQ